MPGLPLVVCETTHSRIHGGMCRQQSRVRLTAEEALAAEESLSIYCKPVELYNILQRRALRNPLFLQRCLHYKIEAKRKHRIQVNVSLSREANSEVQVQNVFPLYVLLAWPDTNAATTEHSAVYRLGRACVLTSFSECGKNRTEASFVIPKVKKSSTVDGLGNPSILLVTFGEGRNASVLNTLDRADQEIEKLEGKCLRGKLPIDSLCLSLETSVNSSLRHSTEVLSNIPMLPSVMMPSFLDRGSHLTIQNSSVDTTCFYQLQVNICAQEIGAGQSSPYDSYTYDDVPISSLSHIIRLRSGNVLFNYRYYNNTLQKTEVTADFSCPFCLMQCASFKGLRYHLISSHDFFNFEFWVTEEYQAVNVSVRTESSRSEISSVGTDLRLQPFLYRSKFKRRRSKLPVENASHVHPHVLSSGSPGPVQENSQEFFPQKRSRDNDLFSKEVVDFKAEFHGVNSMHRTESYSSENHHATECSGPNSYSFDSADVCAANAQASVLNRESDQSMMLPFSKTRKLSAERADPRNRALLQKRQFFHSHRAQPMALEQVFSDRDSEDEVDDDIADFEDRKMLDDFVDVTKDEKQIMHLWNSFVRKQRVLADGHVPWACEAFSRLHGPNLVRNPALLWSWRLFMIKLWNHSLLDARTMDSCNATLQRYQSEQPSMPEHPKQPSSPSLAPATAAAISPSYAPS